MGERKVINKYINPNFDPANIPKRKKPDNLPASSKQNKVRMMLAMNICCKTCGHYMYAGTKFNTRQEKARGEDYLGMPVHRFYMRCKTCSAEISIKTDPKNTDYIVENGATRNYEPLRSEEQQLEDDAEQKREQEEQDAMKALESKTHSSKRQQEVLSNLEELKAQQSQKHKVSEDDVLAALRQRSESEEEQRKRRERELEDEAVREAFGSSCPAAEPDHNDDTPAHDDAPEPSHKRQRVSEDEDHAPRAGSSSSMGGFAALEEKGRRRSDDEPRRVGIRSAGREMMPRVKPKARTAEKHQGNQERGQSNGAEDPEERLQDEPTVKQSDGLASLLAAYGSDEDE